MPSKRKRDILDGFDPNQSDPEVEHSDFDAQKDSRPARLKVTFKRPNKNDPTSSADPPAPAPMEQLEIMTMRLAEDDTSESQYRVRIGGQVKLFVVAPGTVDRDTLARPLSFLPSLPSGQEWMIAYISRDKASGDLLARFSAWARAGCGQV